MEKGQLPKMWRQWDRTGAEAMSEPEEPINVRVAKALDPDWAPMSPDAAWLMRVVEENGLDVVCVPDQSGNQGWHVFNSNGRSEGNGNTLAAAICLWVIAARADGIEVRGL
jgi:hypothetical protein